MSFISFLFLIGLNGFLNKKTLSVKKALVCTPVQRTKPRLRKFLESALLKSNKSEKDLSDAVEKYESSDKEFHSIK